MGSRRREFVIYLLGDFKVNRCKKKKLSLDYHIDFLAISSGIMEENVKKFQRLDLEVQKVKKFPQFLCTTFDCDKGEEEPNLAEHIEVMNRIKEVLTEVLEHREKVVNDHKKMSEFIESVDEKLKETLQQFKPSCITSNIFKDFPEYDN